MTGSDEVPVLGFGKDAKIDFYSPETVMRGGHSRTERRLPSASTCDLCLHLPRGVASTELALMMEQAVLESHGFGFM